MFGCRFVLVALLLSSAVPIRAQEPAGGAEAESVEHVARLVERLGSDDFAVREDATAQLGRLGLAERQSLRAHLQHKDLEVRLRVQQILSRTEREEFERQLSLFLKDEQFAEGFTLPGWDRFREICGRDMAARRLYVDMIRYEAELIEAMVHSPEEVARRLEQRAQYLQALNSAAQGGAIHPASVASLLFVGAETSNTSGLVSSRIYVLLHHSSNKQAIMGGAHRPLLVRLLERWIVARANVALDDFGLQLALGYDLQETALRVARQHLDAQTPRSLPHAAIAVGRFGNRDEDFERLMRHVQNKQVCHTWSNAQLKKDGVIEIQIRDVVLVMLLHFTGQDPKQYGFDLLQPNPTTMYHIYTFGFIETEQREAAHAKWEAWCQAEGVTAEE